VNSVCESLPIITDETSTALLTASKVGWEASRAWEVTSTVRVVKAAA